MKKIQSKYMLLLSITISLFLLKLAIPIINDLYWIFFFITICATVIYMLKQKLSFVGLVKYALDIFFANKVFFILLFLWILIDIVNCFYAQSQITFGNIYLFSLSKYMSFIQMILFFLCILIITYNNKSLLYKVLQKIAISTAISGFIATVIAIINYCYPIMHTERINNISVAADWNVFGSYFLFVYIVSLWCIFKYCNVRSSIKLLLLAIQIFLTIQIVLLSVSRRTIILFMAFSIVMMGYIIISLVKNTNGNIKKVLAVFVFIFILILIGLLGYRVNSAIVKYTNSNLEMKIARIEICNDRTNTFNTLVGAVNDIMNGNNLSDLKNNDDTYESPILERFKSYENGGFFSDRMQLFEKAIMEISKFNIREFLVGKGIGYSYLIYEDESKEKIKSNKNTDESENNGKTYPHNYLLQDFLDGGLIKFLVSICFTLILAIFILRKIVNHNEHYVPVSFVMSLVFFNIFVSGSVGFIGDRFFQVCFLFIVLYNYYETTKWDW